MERKLTASVLFVGTVHSDPEGLGKCLALFDRVNPELILVELSPYGCRYRQKNRRQLQKTLLRNIRKAARNYGISAARARKHPQIERIFNQISLPFEYRAAVKFSKQRNAEVALVDSSPFSHECIAGWDELISTSNLEILLSLPPDRPSMMETYQLARRTLASSENQTALPPTIKAAGDMELWAQRERFMASEIKCKVAQFLPERAIYIGGWWHLTRGTTIPTLRNLLEFETAQFRLLDGA